MVTKLTTHKEQDDAGDLRSTTTPEQRLNMLWELSRDLYLFMGEPVAEPGLHRHIVLVFRRKS